MKKIFVFALFAGVFCFNCFGSFAFAQDIETIKSFQEELSAKLNKDISVQKRVSDIGYKLLNANKIDVRMTFVYRNKSSKRENDSDLIKRQIVVYDNVVQFASDDNELAAFLARKICKGAESYDGIFNGVLTSVQVKSAPKKYEIFFDKRAVDFMVKANYNPIALITFLHKSEPQRRFDKISNHNLISKRLANIYEYIYTQYPSYLLNNEYIDNEAYQHFLLSSIENRRKLYKKITTHSKRAVDYE